MHKKKASIVIGLGFGDEGKGLTTHFLSLQSPNSLVIRFNGGQQAGHTVRTKQGKNHIFSNFGAGTFSQIPTYWSQFCTFSPSSLLKEYEMLQQQIQHLPILWVDKLCPVTTHYDILFNRLSEQYRGLQKHGSCGMGFGSTIERHENSPTKLFAQDLQFPEIVAIKLRAIRQYYQEKALKQGFTEFAELPHEQEDSRFINYTLDLQSLKEKGVLLWVNEQEVFSEHTTFEHFIFEGAQGILLDMDFGFFPNVTRSNTSSKNALQLIKRNNLIFEKIDLWYVSRAYHTRHGAGWFPLEQHPLVLINTEKETNQLNDYQGFFRKAPLHIDLVRYALEIDNSFSKDFSKNIIITCTDQIPDNQLFVFKEQKLQHTKLEHLPNLLEHHFSKVLFSKNDYSEGLLD